VEAVKGMYVIAVILLIIAVIERIPDGARWSVGRRLGRDPEGI
jgi:hypothetical protein